MVGLHSSGSSTARKPATGGLVYSPPAQAQSAVSAALMPSRKTKLCTAVLALPQIGAMRSTMSG